MLWFKFIIGLIFFGQSHFYSIVSIMVMTIRQWNAFKNVEPRISLKQISTRVFSYDNIHVAIHLNLLFGGFVISLI